LIAEIVDKCSQTKIPQGIFTKRFRPRATPSQRNAKVDGALHKGRAGQCQIKVAATPNIELLARAEALPCYRTAADHRLYVTVASLAQAVAQGLAEGYVVLVGSKASGENLGKAGLGCLRGRLEMGDPTFDRLG
jgi:hypothetical protein